MDNKAIIQDYMKRVWKDKDMSAIDEVFTDKTIIHSPFRTTESAAAMKDIVERWLEAFPDLELKWIDFIAEGDMVVSRWMAEGTHIGSFFETSPTHREVSYSGITTYKLKDGKVIEYWALVDLHAINMQLDPEANKVRARA